MPFFRNIRYKGPLGPPHSTDKSRTMPTARTLLTAGLALGAIAYAQVCPITSNQAAESERERERERESFE